MNYTRNWIIAESQNLNNLAAYPRNSQLANRGGRMSTPTKQINAL
jgi:hypothetical protein